MTRAYYRLLALPSGTGRELQRECPRQTIEHTTCSERSALLQSARENKTIRLGKTKVPYAVHQKRCNVYRFKPSTHAIAIAALCGQAPLPLPISLASRISNTAPFIKRPLAGPLVSRMHAKELNGRYHHTARH